MNTENFLPWPQFMAALRNEGNTVNAEEAIRRPAAMLVPNMSRDHYDLVDRENWSTLKHMAKSPAHYAHARKNGVADKGVFRVGRCTHTRVFEPHLVEATQVVYGGRKSGDRWQAFLSEHGDKDILTTAEAEVVRAISEAVHANPDAAALIAEGMSEPTLLWTHETQGLDGSPVLFEAKGRPDFLSSRKAIVDLKSTRDASPEGFAREAERYGYGSQLAMYQDGLFAVKGERWPVFVIVAEKAAPWIVQVYEVPEHVLERGRDHYRDLFGRLAFCRATGKFPGYVEGVSELQLPSWAMDSVEDDDVSDLGLTFPEESESESAS